MLKKILLFFLLFTIIIIAFYTYTNSKRPASTQQETEDTREVQRDGDIPHDAAQNFYLDAKQAAEAEEDAQKKAALLFEAGSLLKRTTADTDVITNEFVEIYSDANIGNEDRGLALFKVTQQANGNNRYDLLDQFLTPEQQLLTNTEKNYIVNKKIFGLLPIALVYSDILLYETKQELKYTPEEIYTEVNARVTSDVESFQQQAWMTSLISDTVMHAAVLYSHIDKTEFTNGLSHEVVLDTFAQALKLNAENSPFNPTKDYIYLETINYLLKIGRIEEAMTRSQEFLRQNPSGMIKSYVQNGGLNNERFEHIMNTPEVHKTITDGLEAL